MQEKGQRRISSLAEDLLPVSEVEAGVNVRPAGSVRWQVVGHLPRKAIRHRYQEVGWWCGDSVCPPGGS